jgi:hypothetical protein
MGIIDRQLREGLHPSERSLEISVVEVQARRL